MPFKPRAIEVFVEVSPTPTNGMKKPFVAFVGRTDTVAQAKLLIEGDRREFSNALGGIVSNRRYMVFRAKWAELRSNAFNS